LSSFGDYCTGLAFGFWMCQKCITVKTSGRVERGNTTPLIVVAEWLLVLVWVLDSR